VVLHPPTQLEEALQFGIPAKVQKSLCLSLLWPASKPHSQVFRKPTKPHTWRPFYVQAGYTNTRIPLSLLRQCRRASITRRGQLSGQLPMTARYTPTNSHGQLSGQLPMTARYTPTNSGQNSLCRNGNRMPSWEDGNEEGQGIHSNPPTETLVSTNSVLSTALDSEEVSIRWAHAHEQE
jgi:hypothetical protein